MKRVIELKEHYVKNPDFYPDYLLRDLDLWYYRKCLLSKVIPVGVCLNFYQEEIIEKLVSKINYSRMCKSVWEYLIKYHITGDGCKVYMFDIPKTEKQRLINKCKKMPFTEREIILHTQRWNDMKNSILELQDRALVNDLQKLGLISIIKEDKSFNKRNPNNPERHWFLVKVLIF